MYFQIIQMNTLLSFTESLSVYTKMHTYFFAHFFVSLAFLCSPITWQQFNLFASDF